MDRRRAAAALFALAACFACSTAAPTAPDHTALDLVEGPTEGCYYNFQHYGEGDRIMTNEPCLNCTCHNRMLMCYLRVCPFTKPIGQDCTVEKRADQCCPIVTCPDVPVDLLTSTSTSSPAEYGTTGVGKQDKYGCSINGKYFSEGSKVPPTPNKPCEHCYCIRNMTTCVMQECTLHVDGCTPIYHKDVCCPVRYSCDHPEDEIPLLDDMTTTVRPTPGFLLTTTTIVPVTQPSQDCVHEDQIFPDGAHIKTEKPCEHCYCMKGDIVCVVQGCGTPMENEGKNCTALPLRPGQCCPDTYICEGDERGTDLTTEVIDQSTIPPRRVGVEGSGYRNEPDEPVKEMGIFEPDLEGSGDEYIYTTPVDVVENVAPEKDIPEVIDEIIPTTDKDLNIYQSTELEKEHIPDSTKDSLLLPEQDLMHTTQAISDVTNANTDMETTNSINYSPIEEISSQKETMITTESPFRKEDNDIIADEILIHKEKEITTPYAGYVTEETPYQEVHGIEDSTDFTMTSDKESKPTTESVKYTQDDLEKTKEQDETVVTQQEDVLKDTTLDNKPETTPSKEITTSTIYEKIESPDVSTVNPIYNEIEEHTDNIYNPPRIPGEGDCLLNGITYSNNTDVPRANNCHTSCKCVSSIIKCDPIICSPPPEYMENMNDCQPIYDSPDSCCPTYVCSAKETIPPQPHSQMSGTESPKPIVAEKCSENECSVGGKDEKPSDVSNKQSDCGSNGCEDDIKKIPEDCSDNKCQVSPVIACEGENCDVQSAEKIEPTPDKESHLKDEEPSVCNDKNGCKSPIDTVQEECNGEKCRKKEEPKKDDELFSECSGVDCKSSTDIATTIFHVVDQSTENIIHKDSQHSESPIGTGEVAEEMYIKPSTVEIDQVTDITNPVTLKPNLPNEFVTSENVSEYVESPTTQSAFEITKSDETRPANQFTVVGQNPKETTESHKELLEENDMEEVTEKMIIQEKTTEQEQLVTEKEALHTDYPQSMDTKLDEKLDAFTTESVHITKSEEDYVTSFISPIEENVTKQTIIPTSHQLESSTTDNKLNLVTQIPEFQSEKTESSKEDTLSKSTELPEVELDGDKVQYDTKFTTEKLPEELEINKDLPDVSTEKEQEYFVQPEPTQASQEISTDKNIEIDKGIYNEADIKPTESTASQDEMSEHPNIAEKNETVPDKINSELQPATEEPDDFTTKNIVTMSNVEIISESNIISSEAPQPEHTLGDEMTTKANEMITEVNIPSGELPEFSTLKTETVDHSITDKNIAETSTASKEYFAINESEHAVTEEKTSTQYPEAFETKSDEIEKVTEHITNKVEDLTTKVPYNLLGEKTSMATEAHITTEISTESQDISVTSSVDHTKHQEDVPTESPIVVGISTETVTSPDILNIKDQMHDIEKPVDIENEISLHDDRHENTLSTKSAQLTEKYPEQFTEKSEIPITESNEVLSDDQTSSDGLKIDEKYSESKTTPTDNLITQETSTVARDDSAQMTDNHTNTVIPDSVSSEELTTKVPNEILPSEENDITQDITSKPDEILGQSTFMGPSSTESQEIYEGTIKETPINTTPKLSDEEEDKSLQEIEDQFKTEKTTLKPGDDKDNIEESIKLTTSGQFYTTLQDNELAASTPSSIIETENEKDIEPYTPQVLHNENTFETTQSPSVKDEYLPESTPEIVPIEVITAEVNLQTTERTDNNKEEEEGGITYNKPEEPKAATTLADVQVTENILNIKEKDTELQAITVNPDDHTTPSIEDNKLDEHEHKKPEDEDVPQLQTVSPSILPETDSIFTEAPYALATDTDKPIVPEISEVEIASSTKSPHDKISNEIEDENRVSTINIHTTQSLGQTSEIPEQTQKYETDEELNNNSMLTSQSPERLPSENIYTSTSAPLKEPEEDDETSDKTSQNNVEETEILQNMEPTEISSVSETNEETTENIWTSKAEEELFKEEKKPSTESIIKIDDKSEFEHNVPVIVQGENIPTELNIQESTTLPSKLLSDEIGEEAKVTENVPVTPQDTLSYETTVAVDVTEKSEKEMSPAVTELIIPSENPNVIDTKESSTNLPIDSAQTEDSLHITESKESELPAVDHKTTATILSSEIDSSTHSIPEPITDNQESLKPINAIETTDDYSSVTVQKESNIEPDISTILPNRDIIELSEMSTPSPQEEAITQAEIGQQHTEKQDSQQEPITQSEMDQIYTEKPDSDRDNVAQDVTKVLDDSLTEIKDKTQLDNISLGPEIPDTTSPSSIEKEVQTVKVSTVSDLIPPTENIQIEDKLTPESDVTNIQDIEVVTSPSEPTQKQQDLEKTTLMESENSKTTPSSIELEEHTHINVEELYSSTPIPVIHTTMVYESHEPERGDMPASEEQSKPSDTMSFENEEKPVTNVQDLASTAESTEAPIQNNIETEPHPDKQTSTSTTSEKPVKDVTAVKEEEFIYSSSPETDHDKGLYTTDNVEISQVSTTTTSSDQSTEKHLPTNLSEIPIKPDFAQTTVSEKEILEETSPVTVGKFEQGSSTESPIDKSSETEDKLTSASPSSPVPELPKPALNEEPIEDIASPDFPTSGAGGYGQEPDYVEEDQAFGPGTCRYGGKVYVSAQQIPRDDPCDFCFCFRSDIICLQQSCPPPIHGCHEEPIQGFCCPRYECPVSMATTLNMTTTTTTTTTTLPPHFLPHAYKGAAQRRGCQIKGHTYKVGEVVRASSGPCLHCTCGGDGQMKCDPKACTPEPMLRQMIAAAVSAKRRR